MQANIRCPAKRMTSSTTMCLVISLCLDLSENSLKICEKQSDKKGFENEPNFQLFQVKKYIVFKLGHECRIGHS